MTIGIFVNPGHFGETYPENQWRGNNRSVEYDTPSDRYARFADRRAAARRSARSTTCTTDPDQRAIAGASSGGICAFTVAWERPDAFRKVLSHIGSFTNIRGGHVYPALIRKSDRKPLRVFLQDGSNDLDNPHGNWPLANQEMAAALKFKGYDYKFEFGDGAHTHKHGGAILPDSLRWLWRDRAVHGTCAAVHARPRFAGPGRCAAWRGHEVLAGPARSIPARHATTGSTCRSSTTRRSRPR